MDLLLSSLSVEDKQLSQDEVSRVHDDAQGHIQNFDEEEQHFSQNSFAEALLFAQVLRPCIPSAPA